MLNNIDLTELDLDQIGRLPFHVRVALCAGLFFLIILLLYIVDCRGQMAVLESYQANEVTLRQTFSEKQAQAVNLDAYREQLKLLKTDFGSMLRQLPTKTEVPGVLEDVSKAGIAAGLQFTLFEPSDEKPEDFYSKLPIQIQVLGDYNEFARFVSAVASLNRIVTFNDFSMGLNKQLDTLAKDKNAPPLLMTITANTYRYVDEPVKHVGMQSDNKVH